MDKNSEEYLEMIAEKKLKWLQDYGASFKDVLEDEDGEFILDETDNGSPKEDGYEVKITKVYLPIFDEE